MKHTGLLLLFGLMAALFGGWFLWQGNRLPVTPPSLPPTTAGIPVALTELASGTDASVTTRVNYVITSEDKLRDLWKLISTNEMPPAIDFTKDTVLAVFTGTEPTAGYAISVTKIVDGTERKVTIEIAVPGVTCGAAEVETTPYQILKVPRTDLPLTHEDVTTTTGCLE